MTGQARIWPIAILTSLGLAGCQDTDSIGNIQEGPMRGNSATAVVNEVQGGPSPEVIPRNARPGPAGADPLSGIGNGAEPAP